MSFSGMVEEEFNKLTDAQQSSIYELILLFNAKNNTESKQKKRTFPFDIFKDGNQYMADDFDDIPEGYEEYV